jgi:AraC family transcriptional regulator
MEDVPRENGRLLRDGSPVPAGLREALPERRLAFRELKVFGGVEVARHRFLAGEIGVEPLKGHVVNLHLSGPIRMVTRLDGESWEGSYTRGNVEIFPAGRRIEQVLGEASEDVNVLLEAEFVRRVAADVGADPDRLEILNRFEARDPQIERTMLSFLTELESDGLGSGLYAEALATALAVHLLREHSSLGERAKRKVGQEPLGGLSAKVLGRVLDYVHDNLAGDLTLAGMAREANLSPYHFSRLFKESTGMSPHQYVVRERVERAKRLLLRGDLPGAAVAREVGFYDQGHLARHTRRLLGATPGEILKESKNLRKSGKILQDGAAPPA